MEDSNFKTRQDALQREFDAFTKEKEGLQEQIRKSQQRIGEINVELVRLQGRFEELKSIYEDKPVDKGEEKIE